MPMRVGPISRSRSAARRVVWSRTPPSTLSVALRLSRLARTAVHELRAAERLREVATADSLSELAPAPQVLRLQKSIRPNRHRRRLTRFHRCRDHVFVRRAPRRRRFGRALRPRRNLRNPRRRLRPEVMVKPIKSYDDLLEEPIDVWAVGPGLGKSRAQRNSSNSFAAPRHRW